MTMNKKAETIEDQLFEKAETIEDQLFEYESWDYAGPTGELEFGNITLKVDVGDHPAGTKFAGAFLSPAGILGLRNDDGPGEAYYLNVSIGSKVDMSSLMGEAPSHCGEGCCGGKSGCGDKSN